LRGALPTGGALQVDEIGGRLFRRRIGGRDLAKRRQHAVIAGRALIREQPVEFMVLHKAQLEGMALGRVARIEVFVERLDHARVRDDEAAGPDDGQHHHPAPHRPSRHHRSLTPPWPSVTVGRSTPLSGELSHQARREPGASPIKSAIRLRKSRKTIGFAT
jgi:hypothetical protein